MGIRVVYGNSSSSNGWPMVDEGSCTWTTVPGTDPPVNLEIQNGQPLAILRAFAADFNAYVEPLNDPDSACWTATNSVGDSNHLSGTAMDLNWDSHPFQVADAGFDGAKIATIREMLNFYEGTIWWGNDWDDPKDAMHFQLGSLANGGDIDTYGNPHTQDFINRKIRADGFSTFRRAGQPTPAPPPVSSVMTVPLVQNADGTWTSPSPAWAHLIRRESSGNPTIIQQIIDVNSGGNEAEGLFQITPRTWQAHGGTEFAPSPRLATPQQQAIVAARIFTQNPSGSDWGAGLSGREDAKQLAAGLVPTGTDTQPSSGDDMAAVPQEQWDELFREICGQTHSQSPFRALDEGAIWRPSQFWLNDDGMTHPQYVEWAASRGDPRSVALLHQLATADPGKYPDRAEDIQLAQQVLSRLGGGGSVLAPEVVVPTPIPAPVAPVPSTGGDTIGPSGWVAIAGVIGQVVLWVLPHSISVLPPQWAAAVSGLLALLTALGIYKAPNQKASDVVPPAAPPAPPAPPPPPPPAPPPAAVAPATGSIADALAKTQRDAAELAAKTDALRDNINKTLG